MIRPVRSESIVLLHGLGANRFVMRRLGRLLSRSGYRITNWGYRSTQGSIELHARDFLKRLVSFSAAEPCRPVHLVTHSMGSIVARRALMDVRPLNIGRMVMLAPPNAGSHVARHFSRFAGKLCRPLRELSDSSDSYVNRLEQPQEMEIGIIAAAQDRVVPLESTFLSGQADHIVLPGHHGMIVWRTDTAGQIIHFLKRGRFNHDRNGLGRSIQAVEPCSSIGP